MQLPTSKTPPDQTQTCPVLVLGMGNILLRDEGIGVHVVQAMERLALPAGVELFDGATAGLDLLDALAHRRRVIVIDAVDSTHPPGTALRLAPDDLVPNQGPEVSLHELGFLETLLVARRLGIAPREVVVIGVQPADVSCGLELSSTLAALVPRIIDLVMAEVERDETNGPGERPEREG